MPSAEYAAARARESEMRLEAYLPFAAPILGVPQVPLTWRHLIELSRAGNRFAGTAEPTREDVFDFLWRLHPAFRRPNGELANFSLAAEARGARRPTRFASWLAYWQIHRLARLLSPNFCEPHIRAVVNAAFMDRPQPMSSSDDAPVSPLRALPTWQDYVASEFALAGHSREAVLDYPIAWTFQVLRSRGISQGRGDDYLAPSDKLIGPPPAPVPAESIPSI